MASIEDLKGLFTPVLTPFTDSLEVDGDSFIKICKWLLTQNSGLAPFGTTSEANSLSVEEKIDLLDRLIDEGIPASRIIPGNGACAIPDAVHISKAAVRHGCAATLMLPPFYYKGVSDDGLFRAYSEVIQRVGSQDFRVCLYHIPQVSNVGLSVSLIERLVIIGSAVVLSLTTPQVALAENPFESFFNAIGNSVKGASRAATGVFKSDDDRRRANVNQRQITTEQDLDPNAPPIKPKVVASPVLLNSQKALNKLGYKPGIADGIYGKKTATAIKQFQTSLGRNATGRLTSEERDVLYDQARNPTKFAIQSSPNSSSNNTGSQTNQTQDAGLKDTLPTNSESSYFDADEPEEENIPPKPANN